MHRTQSHGSKAKYLKRMKGFMSSVKGVSHVSRRAKRRLYCRLQLWMWRRRQEKCRLVFFRGKKLASGRRSSSCCSFKTQSWKHKRKFLTHHKPNLEPSPVITPALVSPPRFAGSAETTARRSHPPKPCKSFAASGTRAAPSSPQSSVAHAGVAVRQTTPGVRTPPQGTETFARLGGVGDPSAPALAVEPLLSAGSHESGFVSHFKKQGTKAPAQKLGVNGAPGQHTAATQVSAAKSNPDEKMASKNTMSPRTDVDLKALTKGIHEFLDDFYRKYGSFIPLQRSDLLRHLKTKFNTDFKDRTNLVAEEITKYQTAMVEKPPSSFHVVFKKHTLTLDDLSTLADQNWLNDQVMNMYGELIMEAAQRKVHFFNSFFHRQLVTKGYEGVRRWTKQVELFSKSLLLVPIHLEVHWCLVTADMIKRKISLYDSQGNGLQKVARNILKYLMTEAKEKQQTAFENGWTVSFDEEIPQQTNENDCGVFVLEYSRCLALDQPLHFSQGDIPKIRKRIYRELCGCQLHQQQ